VLKALNLLYPVEAADVARRRHDGTRQQTDLA
jgi:hypothetical protein